MSGCTGNTATFVLDTTGAVGEIQSMTLPEWLLEDIDDSHLGTTGFTTYCPADLTDPGEVTLIIIFDSLVQVPANGVIETGTLTFPLAPGQSTAASLAGSGYIRRYQLPGLANNELNVAELNFRYDGKTGPTFTPAVATP